LISIFGNWRPYRVVYCRYSALRRLLIWFIYYIYLWCLHCGPNCFHFFVFFVFVFFLAFPIPLVPQPSICIPRILSISLFLHLYIFFLSFFSFYIYSLLFTLRAFSITLRLGADYSICDSKWHHSFPYLSSFFSYNTYILHTARPIFRHHIVKAKLFESPMSMHVPVPIHHRNILYKYITQYNYLGKIPLSWVLLFFFFIRFHFIPNF
jgi:hypothetical protein